MKSYAEIGTEIGELVQRKNTAYGSSFAKCGAYLALLYPDGLRPDQYSDALLLARDFDKSMRIATDRDAFGESPYMDKAGYAILGAQLHLQRKEGNAEWHGSANDRTVVEPSMDGSTDSAAPPTGAKTTTSAREKIASGRSTPPKRYLSQTDMTSPNASEAPQPSADGPLDHNCERLARQLLRLMNRCNDFGLCAGCGHVLKSGSLTKHINGGAFIVCSDGCVPEARDEDHVRSAQATSGYVQAVRGTLTRCGGDARGAAGVGRQADPAQDRQLQ